jgi:rhomboid family GlyGly-CTERM serine protease
MIDRLARLRFSDWIAPLGLCGLLLLLYLGGPGVTASLRYERIAILQGQWWRLATGHLVHGDAMHLAWNVLGIGIVWGLFAREYHWRQWSMILLASTAAIDAGFLLYAPGLDWYLGFSGVLHGAMAAGLVAWLRVARDPLGVLVTVLFAAKLAWEHLHGALPFTSVTLSLPVVHQAHTYGALGGGVAALFLRPSRLAEGSSL